jgi:hypothetical protein
MRREELSNGLYALLVLVLALLRNYQLSKAIINGNLGEHLHYNCVVISDEMQMEAITQYYGYEQVVLLTFKRAWIRSQLRINSSTNLTSR